MIIKPTVLVLGAGASQPYGYPSGYGLKQKIISNQLSAAAMPMYVQLGFEPDFVNHFKSELYRSPLRSVDAFLERRKEFILIGKIAMARELINYEDEENLIEKDDWYQYLFNKMNSTFEDFKKNKLSIITFNYDRSFEHFMMISLMSSYGKTETECAEAMKNIPILHVHGKLGSLPWEQSLSFKRPYVGTSDVNEINNISKEIIIIHEEDPSRDALFSQAFEYFKLAERIYFLGFGYGALNVERLQIGTLNTAGKEVLGTIYDLKDGEKDEITALTASKIGFAHPSYDALSFLRNHGKFL